MCCTRFGVMSSITTYCFTLLWSHWPFSSSDIPSLFLTWGLYSSYSCCLEYISLSLNPRLFEWLALHYSGPVHLSLLQGSFLTTLTVTALSPPSQPAHHFTLFSLEYLSQCACSWRLDMRAQEYRCSKKIGGMF